MCIIAFTRMLQRRPRVTQGGSSAASDVYKSPKLGWACSLQNKRARFFLRRQLGKMTRLWLSPSMSWATPMSGQKNMKRLWSACFRRQLRLPNHPPMGTTSPTLAALPPSGRLCAFFTFEHQFGGHEHWLSCGRFGVSWPRRGARRIVPVTSSNITCSSPLE